MLKSGTIESGIQYLYDTEKNTVTFMGEDSHGILSEEAGRFVHNNYIKHVIVGKGITAIGDKAFSDCLNVMSIALSDSIMSIGKYAFANCATLKTIEIPEKVKRIEAYTFWCCQSLEHITYSRDVSYIGEEAFCGCNHLNMSTISATKVTEILMGTFEDCVQFQTFEIPCNITSIGELAFHHCSQLVTLTIPCTVKKIGTGAMLFCYSLSNINYGGTEKQWHELTDNVDLGLYKSTIIHFAE